MVVTGYPHCGRRSWQRHAPRRWPISGWTLDRRTLLVFGGSRGSRSINRALAQILPDLLAEGVQVLHVTGTLDWPEIEAIAQWSSARWVSGVCLPAS